MPSWVYATVLQLPEDKKPAFALQSTLNWARALAFEILQEHGPDYPSWVSSFRKKLSPTLCAPKTPVPLGESVVPLISSITFSLSLRALETASITSPWLRPGAVVTWYYALYGAARSMLASVAQTAGDDHRKTMRTFQGSLAGRLPHPFNMKASWIKNEDFGASLPSVPAVNPYDLTKTFVPSRAEAQGMLLQYLSGTAAHYTERTKRNLSKQFPTGFKSLAARAARDKSIDKQIGLMHCAFRFRGKANYRDALYLAYGQRNPPAGARFVKDLRVVAQAISVLALVVFGRTRGKQPLANFRTDLSASLRGVNTIPVPERFWEAVP